MGGRTVYELLCNTNPGSHKSVQVFCSIGTISHANQLTVWLTVPRFTTLV